MGILDSMLSAGDGSIVGQLANQFGINPEQTTSAVSSLLPALAGGIKEKLAGGDTGLASLLSSGTLSHFADNPSSLATPEAVDQGKSLLTRIFGSGDTSNIVSTVAEKVGIHSNIVSNMLPVAASLLGGFLSKGVASGGNLADTVGEVAAAGHQGILSAVKSLASKMMGS
jgi:hypothetical protein